MPTLSGSFPEIVYRFPTSQDSPVLQPRPIIILDWSVDINTTQFSNASQRAALINVYEQSNGTQIAIDYLDYDARNRRLRLQVTPNLTPNTEYRIDLAKGIQDSYGRRSLYSYSWTFTTNVSSVSAVLLVAPSNESTQSSFPTFTWAVATGATGINYQFQLAADTSFVGALVDTVVTPNYYTPGSIPSDQTPYYWRVRAVTPTVTGQWSSIWSFYYGTTQQADVGTRTTWVDPIFAVFRSGFKNGLSHRAAFPTLSFTFTSPPASTIGNYATVTRKSVLPRNDVAGDYNEATVGGTWTVAGSTATFVPNESLLGNTRYLITLPETILNRDGVELGVEKNYYFTGQYTPYYVDIRVLKARLRTESTTIPDDQINYFIHLASLEANMRYQAFLLGTALYWYPDSLTETMVRGVVLKSHAVLRWVEAAARVAIYDSILSDEIRNVGRTVRLADYQESLTKDFLAAIELAKKYAEEEMLKWEDYLSPSDTPLMVSRHDMWSDKGWYWDYMVGPIDANREWGF